MLKKGLIVGLGLLLLAGLFFGRSYVSTIWDEGAQMVREAEPIEFQLKRARNLLKEIDPEIRRAMHVTAKAEIEVEQLRDDLTGGEEALADAKSDMMKLKDFYDSGETYFYVGTRSYNRDQVKRDLKNRFAKFQTKEATVDKLQKILNAREKGLDAAHEKLAEMKNAKNQLEIEIENLDAQLKLVRVNETASRVNFDDSKLSQTKELVQDIRTRIDIQEKFLNADTDFDNLIPLDAEDSDDVNISDEIADYFGDGRADIEEIARSLK